MFKNITREILTPLKISMEIIISEEHKKYVKTCNIHVYANTILTTCLFLYREIQA